MSSGTKTEVLASAWESIAQEARRIVSEHGSSLTKNRARFAQNHHRIKGMLIDWSRQRVDAKAMESLIRLGDCSATVEFLNRLARGEALNVTENRSVMHMALRKLHSSQETETTNQIHLERERMLSFAESVRTGQIKSFDGSNFTDVVHIGIGGSHLGPAFVCDALPNDGRLRVHFCSNADRREVRELLNSLSPSRTLFLVASKSYSTRETLENAAFAKSWIIERTNHDVDVSKHFVHISSNKEIEVNDELVFHVPQSIGGRFSLWSAMGLPIALSIGREGFLDLLRGAQDIDDHALNTPVHNNVCVRLALLALWNVNFLGAMSHLVLPYDSRLKLFPAFCQQLEMESNGKSINIEGKSVSAHTCPVVWGGMETDGQHAWHQFLHQGTQAYSADIVVTLDALPSSRDEEVHKWIVANAIGQSAVMLNGRLGSTEEPHKRIAGNHGSTVILLSRLDARTLGSLIAMYEHKVACAGHLWGINSFDQWGVEEGKLLTSRLSEALQGESGDVVDPATTDLVRTIRAWIDRG